MTQPVFRTAVAAWQRTGRACIRLSPLILPTFLLLVAARLGTQAITAGGSPAISGGAIGASILMDLLIGTPLTMAVYRLHLVGERRVGQTFSNWSRLWRLFRGRFLIEVGALLVTAIIVAGLIACLIVIAVIAHIHVARGIERLVILGIFSLGGVIIWWSYVLRRILILPAIAVDAPDTSMRASRARTEGCMWQMAAMLITTELPMGIIAVLFVVGHHVLLQGKIVTVLGLSDVGILSAIVGVLWVVVSTILSASLFSIICREREESAQAS